jgi:hypothetical protein
LLDRLFIPAERLRQHREAFAELERVAFAVEVHFGNDLARQIREPLRACNRIVVTTARQMGLSRMGGPERAGHKLLRKLDVVVYSDGKSGGRGEGDYGDADCLLDEVYKAKVQAEINLRPYLQAPNLKQFLLVPELRAYARRVIDRLVSLGRRLSTLA